MIIDESKQGNRYVCSGSHCHVYSSEKDIDVSLKYLKTELSVFLHFLVFFEMAMCNIAALSILVTDIYASKFALFPMTLRYEKENNFILVVVYLLAISQNSIDL